MPENIRSHVVLAVITLILAVAILVLLFIPKPLPNQFPTSPGSGGQIPSSSQQASTVTYSALVASGLLVIPPLTLSERIES